jgi:predicted metal-binding membrane protein
MKRSVNRYWNPVLAWSELVWKMTEMSIASASVVGHRTSRMAKAGPVPNARDRSELARMGSEKIAAGIESAVALGRHGTATQMNHSARTLGLMLQSATALMSLYGSQNGGQFFARQAKLTKTLTKLAGSSVDLSDSMARLATRGLAPVHSRAVANAKRLGKR